ncbi:EsV-1-199 [Ectocarpus siliculosus]|uniref:EsV-1-199 n=1 Tax=Ectocarpus siliculosus TaxID=2880 RepID=D7FVK3_ECTSI|nr:EsV-1-199 [Ectocarpus siliculosus]|eukprot:CBJ31924.1 EsV-1-199 [Ectocarpus siliculosus]
MSLPPLLQQSPRVVINKLHEAARDGSTWLTAAILSTGSIDIDGGDSSGGTPLMHAICNDHPSVVSILLSKGASVSAINDEGNTALHLSAFAGYVVVTKMLLKAGASVAATGAQGATPLHFAAEKGHLEVVKVLTHAGADVNSRMPSGETPLYGAAWAGWVDVVKELLRAKANPLLTRVNLAWQHLPLDTAAQNGRLGVVLELLQRFGIRGCGGGTGGVTALQLAAMKPHMDVMLALTTAGVVDTGIALVKATSFGHMDVVKFLLQQQNGTPSEKSAYVSRPRDPCGRTPLICNIDVGLNQSCSPKVVRLLVDAGADTTSIVRFTIQPGTLPVVCTPLSLATEALRIKIAYRKAIPDELLRRLELIRRLLLRVEAVHATSWLWQNGVPRVGLPAGGTAATETESSSTTAPQLRTVLPILRRRARGRGFVSASLCRYAVKLDGKP